MISGRRDRRIKSLPPSANSTAAVAIVVRGHRALHPIPSSRNSSAIPKTSIDIAYLDNVYGRCAANHEARKSRGGDRVNICGFKLLRSHGMQQRLATNVPRTLIERSRSKRFIETFKRACKVNRRGIVDANVNAPKVCGGLRDGAYQGIVVAHVDLQGEGPSAGGLDRGGRRMNRPRKFGVTFGSLGGDCNVCPIASRAQCNGQTDSAAAPGHEQSAARQGHVLLHHRVKENPPFTA